jgi:hypothetical protein
MHLSSFNSPWSKEIWESAEDWECIRSVASFEFETVKKLKRNANDLQIVTGLCDLDEVFQDFIYFMP